MRHALGAMLFWLAVWLMAGCAHKLRTTDNANRAEQETRQFQTAATAEVKQQSVATEKKQGKRTTEKFHPSGQLMERVVEQWGSDGRVTTTASASSHAESTGHDFRSVKASSSSTRASDTKAGPPWWLWIVGGVALGLLLWYLVRRWRTRLSPML